MLTKLKPYRYLILILFIVFFLRLPSLFEPNRYADEDIYLTLGMALRKGLVLYRDIHDNKPPLLYLVAALAQTVAGFRFILLLWNLVNVVLVWKIAQILFKKSLPIFLATLLFAIFSSIPFTEGNIANGEIFMIMPTTAALLLFLKPKPNFILIGLLLSLAFLFKVPVFFEFFALLFWLTLYQSASFKNFFSRLFSLPALSLIVSFFTPIFLTIVYFYRLGAGPAYVRAALLQNLGYLSSWEGSRPSFFTSGLFIRLLILLVLYLLAYFIRQSLGRHFGLIYLWFLAALFGALLSGRPYPHYLIEIIAPLSLLLVFYFSSLKLQKIFIAFSLFLTAGSFLYYHFWHYPSLSYYLSSWKYVLHLQSREDYLHYFNGNVATNYKIADYLKDNTSPQDRIFVWGTEPAIYALSGRLPVGKYTVAYHVADFQAYQTTIDSLKALYPPYIVYFPDNPSFPKLDDFINLHYYPVNQIGPAIIFRSRQ